MNNNSFFVKLHDGRLWLWIFLVLIVVLAGVRFSDGSMLLAISRGATIEDPIFKNPAVQYVWDSPLKVFLLHALPAKVIAIAFVFAVLAILPIGGLIVRDERIFWLTFATVFLTPAFKVSVQNVGVGDGLVILLIMLVFYSNRLWLLSSAFFLIALWHPQQSFFIGLSFLLARYCYAEKFDRREPLVVLGIFGCAAFIFIMYKSSLNFHYSGREAYLTEHLRDYLQRNLIYAPIAFAPIVLWFWLIAPKPVRGGLLMAGWLLILGVVSLLAVDVTRVMVIITLPIVLAGAARVMDEAVPVPVGKVAVTAILVALIPPYSWSGLDVWLWSDLMGDMCKWGFYCW